MSKKKTDKPEPSFQEFLERELATPEHPPEIKSFLRGALKARWVQAVADGSALACERPAADAPAIIDAPPKPA